MITITYSLTKNDNHIYIYIIIIKTPTTITLITLIIISCDNGAQSYHLVFSRVFHWPSKLSHESGLASSRLWRDLLLSPCCTQNSIPSKALNKLVDIVVQNEGPPWKCLKLNIIERFFWNQKIWGHVLVVFQLVPPVTIRQASIDLATLCECTEDISSEKTAAKSDPGKTSYGGIAVIPTYTKFT